MWFYLSGARLLLVKRAARHSPAGQTFQVAGALKSNSAKRSDKICGRVINVACAAYALNISPRRTRAIRRLVEHLTRKVNVLSSAFLLSIFDQIEIAQLKSTRDA